MKETGEVKMKPWVPAWRASDQTVPDGGGERRRLFNNAVGLGI